MGKQAIFFLLQQVTLESMDQIKSGFSICHGEIQIVFQILQGQVQFGGRRGIIKINLGN